MSSESGVRTPYSTSITFRACRSPFSPRRSDVAQPVSRRRNLHRGRHPHGELQSRRPCGRHQGSEVRDVDGAPLRMPAELVDPTTAPEEQRDAKAVGRAHGRDTFSQRIPREDKDFGWARAMGGPSTRRVLRCRSACSSRAYRGKDCYQPQ